MNSIAYANAMRFCRIGQSRRLDGTRANSRIMRGSHETLPSLVKVKREPNRRASRPCAGRVVFGPYARKALPDIGGNMRRRNRDSLLQCLLRLRSPTELP